jgi:hypothetical protein
MRIGHWIAVAATIYFVYGAVQNVTMANTSLPALPAVPDAGSVLTPGYTAAAADLAVAALLYFLVLHKRLMAA